LETYNPDDQLQQLRQWLRDNGPALLAGLLLGAALVAGWSGWKFYSARQALQASAEYEHLRRVLQSADGEHGGAQGQAAHAEEIVATLTGRYARTPYAALGALTLAADQVRRGQHEAALAQYAWVRENARDRKLRHVARLRRARMLWSLGRSEEALAELQARKAGSFAPLFAELRGDILAAQGRRDEARQAYAEALAAADYAPELRAGVELKLNDLSSDAPPATPPAAAGAR
jgi:predicted negative regulator of RcsB-dependent stress response